MASVGARSKEAKALQSLCAALNVDMGNKIDDALAELMARFRALDILEAPL